MATIERITTAEQLFEAGDIGRCELVGGELRQMNPAGNEHGRVTFNLALLLGAHVKKLDLGAMYTAETGFILGRDPDTVRAPDIAFIHSDRAPDRNAPGFVTVVPDLVVEVNSPSDRASDVSARVMQWLQAGCTLVWVVDRAPRTVTSYEAAGHADVIDESGVLTGGDVIPGFEVQLRAFFGE